MAGDGGEGKGWWLGAHRYATVGDELMTCSGRSRTSELVMTGLRNSRSTPDRRRAIALRCLWCRRQCARGETSLHAKVFPHLPPVSAPLRMGQKRRGLSKGSLLFPLCNSNNNILQLDQLCLNSDQPPPWPLAASCLGMCPRRGRSRSLMPRDVGARTAAGADGRSDDEPCVEHRRCG